MIRIEKWKLLECYDLLELFKIHWYSFNVDNSFWICKLLKERIDKYQIAQSILIRQEINYWRKFVWPNFASLIADTLVSQQKDS